MSVVSSKDLPTPNIVGTLFINEAIVIDVVRLGRRRWRGRKGLVPTAELRVKCAGEPAEMMVVCEGDTIKERLTIKLGH